MRKTGWSIFTLLAAVGLTCNVQAAQWIQQNKWTVSGRYPGSCGMNLGTNILNDIGFSDVSYRPVHGTPTPHPENLITTDGKTNFTTWQNGAAKGAGGNGD